MSRNPIVTALKVAAGLSAGTFFIAYSADSRALIHPLVTMPLLHQLDPEKAHKLSIFLASWNLCPRDTRPEPARLALKIWGQDISNPIGLAAGYDKHGEAVDAMMNLGFGLVEVGSVTPVPQNGNPLPRFFRLSKDDAVINRYGFNSVGHLIVKQRLQERLRRHFWWHGDSSTQEASFFRNSLHPNKLLGINLGKNKTSAADSHDDYLQGIESLGPLADYLVINISSPNTPGLRSLQRRAPMERLLSLAKTKRDKILGQSGKTIPLLVKIAPDCDEEELKDIAAVVQNVQIDGIIISNTTISRPTTLVSDESLVREAGGLSGTPVKPLALAAVSTFYKLTDGKVPIIGCGGISSAQDCIDFAKAGASLVQIYTGLGFKGPGLITGIKGDLNVFLEKKGLVWSDLIGLDHRQ